MDIAEKLRRRIAEAAENVAAAEREVEAALAATRSDDPRALKQMISSRLESAFERLAATRKTLEEALATTG